MKKIILALLMVIGATTLSAQEKGRFEIHKFDTFKLHVYYTNNVMNDISYIIEGQQAVITLEEPLFKDNIAEYNAYLEKLNKPVTHRIANYHIGGTSEHELIMPEGMPEFVKGPIYSGMMKGFSKKFGDAITVININKVSEVTFGSTQTFAGIPFKFYHGPSSDFPAACLLIGGEVYYTHWTPAIAHANHIQISSPEAIDAELNAAKESLRSKASLFIGGHGGVADADVVKFKINYLKKMKSLFKANKTAEDFVIAMKKAFPNIPGEQDLNVLAKKLYK